MKPGLREQVMDRDRGCVLYRLEPGHICYTRWGTEHPWDATDLLTLEHVKGDLRMGKRAPDDIAFMVALCGAANNRPPSKTQRSLMREYLRSVAA